MFELAGFAKGARVGREFGIIRNGLAKLLLVLRTAKRTFNILSTFLLTSPLLFGAAAVFLVMFGRFCSIVIRDSPWGSLARALRNLNKVPFPICISNSRKPL